MNDLTLLGELILVSNDDVLYVEGEELHVLGVFLALKLTSRLNSSLLARLHRSDYCSTALRTGLSR